MPRIEPFYSKQKGSVVYHNNTNCPVGRSIAKENLVQGSAGKRRICKQCAKINRHRGKEKLQKLLMMAYSSWQHARNEVLEKNRYFPKVPEEFLEVIKLLCKTAERTIKKGRILYRARIMDDTLKNEETKPPYYGYTAEGSFVPPYSDITNDGRANPKLIRYLYVSESPITAIMETRPILEEKVNVAEIEVTEPLKIASLIQIPTMSTIDEFFRFMLAREFAQPVRETTDYIFSQYLSEYIKKLGYDGIRFNSSTDKSGVNLTIFNYDKCKPISSSVYRVTGIEYHAKPHQPKKGRELKNDCKRGYEEETQAQKSQKELKRFKARMARQKYLQKRKNEKGKNT